MTLVTKTLEECQLAANDPARDLPDKDFMIVALDLLSGIVQALNTEAEPLVAGTTPSVVQLLSICIQVRIILRDWFFLLKYLNFFSSCVCIIG